MNLQHIEDIFHRARSVGPADRAAFLDEACADDLPVRAEVESLLAHAEGATDDLCGPTPTFTPTLVDRGPVSEGPGALIGYYKILQQIGEGGFGVVYMAEQQQPVRRKVAVKIIKLGMDTKQVIARFEAERQALALMDHPNIARVLDAGATETGRPYFVMELVRGIPVTEYCDTNKLDSKARLALFMDICHAIQHAHQKGIIHRDLKPSNILVTLHDDRLVPKVIDFGIAKATDHRLTEKTLFTEFRQFIGTPEYMSPDQAEISGLDVDTRSDIYSLGVLLYELLTGTTPFDATTLRSAGYGEIQRIIREEEPPRPSNRVNTLVGETASTIARQRASEINALSKNLKGDLDWIVMRAMEKDRTRRYQTASELADDVRRHLDDEPVVAGPPGVLYKTHKFVLRHRMGVLASGLIVAAVVVGLGLSMIGLVRANREAAHSRAVSEFLQDLTLRFEAGGADDVTVEEIVARGRQLFGDEHAVVAALLSTRAATLSTVGELDRSLLAHEEALVLYRREYSGDHPAVAAALSAIGSIHDEKREYVEGQATLREALAMKRRLYGEYHRLTADAYDAMVSLLTKLEDDTQNSEILSLWEHAIEGYAASLGDEHRTTVTTRLEHARWLFASGDRKTSGPALAKAVEQGRRVLGHGDLNFYMTLNSLAQYRLWVDQDLSATADIADEMVVVAKRCFGDANEAVASLMLQTMALRLQDDDNDGALATVERYLDERDTHEWKPAFTIHVMELDLLRVLNDLLDVHVDVGRRFFLQAISDTRVAEDPTSERLSKSLVYAARWLSDHGFVEEAVALDEEFLLLQREHSVLESDVFARVLVAIAERLLTLERPSEAEPLVLEAIVLQDGDLEPGHWRRGLTRSVLGACLLEQGRFQDAETELLAAFDLLDNATDTPEPRRNDVVERLVELYERWSRPDDVLRWSAQRSPSPHDTPPSPANQ